MSAITFKAVNPSTVASQQNFDVMEIENEFCRAVITRQGAQILSFERKIKSAETDVVDVKSLLWCSELSLQQFLDDLKCDRKTKAIRGGIPLCFPWFGGHLTDAKLPSHGFARTQLWELTSVDESAQGQQLVFTLQNDAITDLFWHHQFRLTLSMTCGEKLHLALNIENVGKTDFDCEFAWHSYFPVSAIENVNIDGLQGKKFLDQLTNETYVQEHAQIHFDQETDRIYQNVAENYQIHDGLRQIDIQTKDCKSAIVWNPWIKKTQRLEDVDAQAWQKFVCLECANVRENRLHIKAGQSDQFSMVILGSR